jgi:glycosyltransferase involved in cell wall biosynthesis
MRVTENITTDTASASSKRLRVLYSFPHKLGADRICTTAWHQVAGLAAAGAEVLAFPGVLHRPVPESVTVRPTLSWGKARVSYKLAGGARASALHDYIVSRRIQKLAGQIDIIHTWPMGAIRTLRVAARLGIPTVLERPNAHTEFAMIAVREECERLGLSLPRGHEHEYNETTLRLEKEEYRLADRLLCPSDFVQRTFLDRGFSAESLERHQYGFDETLYHPDRGPRGSKRGLTVLFAGGCAPRKGLHYALEAWLRSPAHREGKFLIAGGFVPGYAEVLSRMLAHPSVEVLGHRRDLPELMRKSDILILPSIEEGSALVTSEARGSGCVLLVSEAAGAICQNGENALVHRVGDVETLAQQLAVLDTNRDLLERLRAASLRTVNEITWTAAGVKLLQVYRQVVREYAAKRESACSQSPSRQSMGTKA